MDILDIRNLQLSYQAVYDETLCESMEDMGIIGEARDGYGDDSKFKQDTDADSFRPGKDVPKVKKFGRISRAMPPQISGHATKTVSANTRTRGEDPGAPRSQKMFKTKKMVKRDGKWVKEELKAWVDALIAEGYDLSEYTWDDMYEIYESYIAESDDLYDIILSHLLDEGYANTVENAEAIMVNMSEEWRESICEGLGGAKKQQDYDEYNREARQWMAAELSKLKKRLKREASAKEAQEFLTKHPKKTK